MTPAASGVKLRVQPARHRNSDLVCIGPSGLSWLRSGRDASRNAQPEAAFSIAMKPSASSFLLWAVDLNAPNGNESLDLGKTNIQLKANVKNQDRSQCGQNNASGMVSFVCRT